MKQLDWPALPPIVGAVVGGLTALSATVVLLVHTPPAEPAESVPPPPNSAVETAPARPLGIDLPRAITDSGSCVIPPRNALPTFSCGTSDGKPLTAVKFADNAAARDATSKYPTSWPANATALGRYAVELDWDGSWVLRWAQNSMATVIAVPGFKDKPAAEQWFREIDPQLEPR
ncbi:hypothetical protein ACQPW1_24510 [Nocardia sp. CA-128927]|uniref:hypothetical protein n=1 Tax=Nocardia sp. CA-128927 TaxID=3239975 RepID=UPI003D99EC33